MMRRKITIVGAGATGATAAHILAARDYADVVLTDIKEGLPQGKALDLNQMGPVLGFEPRITGTNSYEETAGSDVVVITAGLPRSPGMSRDDLVTTNEKIVGSVTEQIVAQSAGCTIIVLSNPLDAMCHVAKSVSGFPKERVFGQAGILDTARLQTFIAWETGASVKDVSAVVAPTLFPKLTVPMPADTVRLLAPSTVEAKVTLLLVVLRPVAPLIQAPKAT